jgi:hypothetical protein
VVMDENLDDWIYGCMGSAVTDYDLKFLKERRHGLQHWLLE